MKNVTDRLIEEFEEFHTGSLTQAIIPSSVKSLLNEVLEIDSSTPRQGGCNDPFQIFGFLAFLLVILQLLANNGNKRKRRSLQISIQESCQYQSDEYLKVGGEAVYSLLLGFINAVKSESTNCKNKSFCEGVHQASNLGHVGQIISKVSIINAPSWLQSMDPRKKKQFQKAGFQGFLKKNCSILYPCNTD